MRLIKEVDEDKKQNGKSEQFKLEINQAERSVNEDLNKEPNIFTSPKISNKNP